MNLQMHQSIFDSSVFHRSVYVGHGIVPNTTSQTITDIRQTLHALLPLWDSVFIRAQGQLDPSAYVIALDVRRDYVKSIAISSNNNSVIKNTTDIGVLCGNLAPQLAGISRFVRDPITAPNATRFYTIWLENAHILGRLLTLSEYPTETVVAYSVIDTGIRVDLIAVSNQLRGTGAAQRLMAEAESLVPFGGELRVKASTSNLRACAFYERLGYSDGGQDTVFHLHTIRNTP